MNAALLLLGGAPDATALIDAAGKVTYAELKRRVERAAAEWKRQGIGPGERCVIGLNDGIDWVVAFLGLIWMGGVPIAVSPRTEAALLKDLITDSGAKSLLLEDATAVALADSRAQGRLAWLLRLKMPATTVAAQQAEAESPAFWLYSSGTTGNPKGIIHPHRVVAHAHAFAREVLGATAEDIFYSTSKMFFAYPLGNALFAGLRLGACVVLDEEWPNPQRVAQNIEKHRPTLFFSVPTLYRRLLEAGVAFPAVRCAVSAGEACPPDVAEGWRRATGIQLFNGYGTTETLSLMLYCTTDLPGLKPTPLTIVRTESDEGSRDGACRLWFSHPGVALGYSRVITHDSARFGPNGFSPGDLFRSAGGGQPPTWKFAGRSDQLVKVFGRWVDTLALEHDIGQRLQGHVREVCIVPQGGEQEDVTALHLFAIPGAEQHIEVRCAIEAALTEYPAYLKPRSIQLVSDFPRTETGKLRRGELIRLIRAGTSQATR
ncbi:MAG: AMP-binding protein [Betaproteobacteria bacterium]|nr:AMP-binding protein [Betaproteobacteria bacterium]